MAKPGDLKWDDLIKGDVGGPKHPLHRPVKTGPVLEKSKDGKLKEPYRPKDIEISRAIMANMPASMRQPTHEEMVKAAIAQGIQKTPEEMAEKQKDWENSINDFYKTALKPIEQQDSKENETWGSGKSFNDDLSEEELKQRNMDIGEE